MALYSQRNGFRPIEKPFQLNSLDNETRNQIWSLLHLNIFSKYHPQYPYSSFDAEAKKVEDFIGSLWTWYFKEPADSLEDPMICIVTVKTVIFERDFYEVLDLVEWIVKTCTDRKIEFLKEALNSLFQRESCGFRFVNDEIIDITNQIEIDEIEKASKSKAPYSVHLERALELLADKKAPDFRNSVKESISAVEAICRDICKNDKATLGDALKMLKSEIALNPIFQLSMSKLYGFVSDDGGIRHSLLESSSKINYSDAKYFIVSCSAFVNYINELR